MYWWQTATCCICWSFCLSNLICVLRCVRNSIFSINSIISKHISITMNAANIMTHYHLSSVFLQSILLGLVDKKITNTRFDRWITDLFKPCIHAFCLGSKNKYKNVSTNEESIRGNWTGIRWGLFKSDDSVQFETVICLFIQIIRSHKCHTALWWVLNSQRGMILIRDIILKNPLDWSSPLFDFIELRSNRLNFQQNLANSFITFIQYYSVSQNETGRLSSFL